LTDETLVNHSTVLQCKSYRIHRDYLDIREI